MDIYNIYIYHLCICVAVYVCVFDLCMCFLTFLKQAFAQQFPSNQHSLTPTSTKNSFPQHFLEFFKYSLKSY